MYARFHLDITQVYSLQDLDIIQIGRRHCDPDTVIRPHIHLDWYELTIATEGSGEVLTGNVPTAVSSGDIYFSYPCDVHAITSHRDSPLKYDYFAFRPKSEALIQALDRIVESRSGADRRVIRDDRIAALVSDAIAEFCSPEADSHRLLEAIFCQLIAYLLRDLNSLSLERPPTHFSAAESLCFRLMNYIDTHLYSLKNLHELSELTVYHYSYLSNLFHKTTGMTLFDYCHGKRLEAARLLLREENRRVGEIADILGYSSVYSFSKAYRKRFGISPGVEKKQNAHFSNP